MWLFDNIFLDKDTPTALLNNPEIKAPDWEKKPEAAKAAYDPKNDPIAPAEGATGTTGGETAAADVSFDIGGDIDFSSLWGDTGNATGGTNVGVPQTDGTNSPIWWTDSPSSIAMVQWGTASAIESIDIGGIDGIKVDIPGEANAGAWTGSGTWEGNWNGTWNSDGTGSTGSVDIQIHDIEEHTPEWTTEAVTWTETGILNMLGRSDAEVVEVAAAPVAPETTEVPTDFLEATEVPSLVDTSTVSMIEEPVVTETPLADIGIDFALPSSDEVHASGRIAELIGKLIEELKKLDEEEKTAHREREAKIKDIDARTKALDEEYTTRKKALEYERSSIDLPIERSAEKERIKSLISGFEKDLDTV